jgi:hypothetical protein
MQHVQSVNMFALNAKLREEALPFDFKEQGFILQIIRILIPPVRGISIPQVEGAAPAVNQSCHRRMIVPILHLKNSIQFSVSM